jgi:putative hydrolase of the HAD superfamily
LPEAVIAQIIETDNRSWMQFDQIMWDWIAELRTAGKRVAMLSNMPRDLGEALASQTDRLNVFDHVTVSYDIRSAKPEPAIYEHCLAGIGTAPERTIFLDDRIANVRGAESLGIQAIEFLNRDDVLSRLRG